MQSVARVMSDPVRHRGPDARGEWIDADAGIAFGHTRLSILDLSEAGSQPMASHSGRYVLTFNGEIYNHLALRDRLAGEGGQPGWRGSSDTETILACVDSWGIDQTLDSVIGMFALGLWDRQERRLTLARDRMGEKPLYYGKAGRSIVFGSELKALKAHPEFDNAIDRRAAALFVCHNYVPAPLSIYENIRKLPAGTRLTVDTPDSLPDPAVYWSLRKAVLEGKAAPFEGDLSSASEELEYLLKDVVRSQMISDVPLGAFLSGGIDSSSIVAMMQQVSSVPVHTFSIGFDEAGFSEADAARNVARHLGTKHTELTVTQRDALDLVGSLPQAFCEPFADSSQIPALLLSRLTSNHVTVAMSGDGADELFGGYNRYFWAPALWNKTGWLPRPLMACAGTLLSMFPANGSSRASSAFRFASEKFGVPLTLGSKLSQVGSILRSSSGPDDIYAELVSEWKPEDSLVVGLHEIQRAAFYDYELPSQLSAAERMMVWDSMTYLADDILVKVDRSAMTHSIETRAPFLDPRIVDFAWRLPQEMKLSGSGGKLVLKKMLHKHVPSALVDRPKQGFAIPLDRWLRGELRHWAEHLLDKTRLIDDGYFNVEPICRAWRTHLSGKRNNGSKLWPVLMFNAWHEAL